MPPLFARIRQAFIPKDPLYRRESGAGRRVILVAKLVGALVVFGAYAIWITAMAHRQYWGQPLLAAATGTLYVLAFVLGMQSVRGEVSDGTAQSLILTPLPRRRIVLSKLAGSAEFLGIAALLLPLYWFAADWERCNDYLMTFLHGGALRFGGAADRLGFPLYPGDMSPKCLAVGTAAFAGDLAWYALFASCGMLAATSARTTGGAWAKGLAWAAALAVALTLVEWFGFDLAGEPPFGSTTWSSLRLKSLLDGLGLTGAGKLDYRELADAIDIRGSSRPVVWVVAWLGVAMVVRLGLAWLFVRLAARRFDRIATD